MSSNISHVNTGFEVFAYSFEFKSVSGVSSSMFPVDLIYF